MPRPDHTPRTRARRPPARSRPEMRSGKPCGKYPGRADPWPCRRARYGAGQLWSELELSLFHSFSLPLLNERRLKAVHISCDILFHEYHHRRYPSWAIGAWDKALRMVSLTTN